MVLRLSSKAELPLNATLVIVSGLRRALEVILGSRWAPKLLLLRLGPTVGIALWASILNVVAVVVPLLLS